MRTEQLKLSIATEDLDRQRRRQRRSDNDELDEQIAAALSRVENFLGVEAHKWLADELSDDDAHPVSVTQVYDWLSRRNGRRPPGEMLCVLAVHDEAFGVWFCQKHGYTTPKKITRLLADEQCARLRRALLEFGVAGEKKLRELDSLAPEAAPPELRSIK